MNWSLFKPHGLFFLPSEWQVNSLSYAQHWTTLLPAFFFLSRATNWYNIWPSLILLAIILTTNLRPTTATTASKAKHPDSIYFRSVTGTFFFFSLVPCPNYSYYYFLLNCEYWNIDIYWFFTLFLHFTTECWFFMHKMSRNSNTPEPQPGSRYYEMFVETPKQFKEANKYPCDKCAAIFTNTTLLKRHTNIYHKNSSSITQLF